VKLGASHRSAVRGIAEIPPAKLTISGVEARRSDGGWVAVENGLPAVVDLGDLAVSRRTVTLPADLFPEGQYAALQIRIAKVGAMRDGPGWVALVPVDFGVTAGGVTVLDLEFRLERSFRTVSGLLEFEPEIEVAGVERR
jgi:hypothetical protein